MIFNCRSPHPGEVLRSPLIFVPPFYGQGTDEVALKNPCYVRGNLGENPREGHFNQFVEFVLFKETVSLVMCDGCKLFSYRSLEFANHRHRNLLKNNSRLLSMTAPKVLDYQLPKKHSISEFFTN